MSTNLLTLFLYKRGYFKSNFVNSAFSLGFIKILFYAKRSFLYCDSKTVFDSNIRKCFENNKGPGVAN